VNLLKTVSSMQTVNTKKHRSRDILRHVLRRDNTSMGILLAAAVVGAITGILGVAFEKVVDGLTHWRLLFLLSLPFHTSLQGWQLWLSAFVISALLAMWGYFLVRRIAPEASGSGIPEIEGALEELRPVRWWRVIPVKFFGGMGALSSGMVLGREGPSVQMGGNVGRMVGDILRMRDKESRHTLLATGAAAGLAAAFNAPLAGILFIIEEMRLQFRYTLISIKAVFIGVIAASIVFRLANGDVAVINVGNLGNVSLQSLWLYLLLGMLFGIVGVAFNRLIFLFQDGFAHIYGGRLTRVLVVGALIGGSCGVLSLFWPEVTGGGFAIIPAVSAGKYSAMILLSTFLVRVFITLLCFSSGAPGGIFAPMLALGTLLGGVFGSLMCLLFPAYGLHVGPFAIAGMGALFAASVRAPLTGIVLVLEMTDNYQLILPMIITCLGATLLAQFLGGKPLYSTILARTLQKQYAENATCQPVNSAQDLR
jgi:CIC family chloride channel protein